MTEGIADYEAARELARQQGEVAVECRVLARLAVAHWSIGHSVEGLALAHEVEAKAQALGDRDLALQASVVVGAAY